MGQRRGIGRRGLLFRGLDEVILIKEGKVEMPELVQVSHRNIRRLRNKSCKKCLQPFIVGDWIIRLRHHCFHKHCFDDMLFVSRRDPKPPMPLPLLKAEVGI
jgi:hypothetical protein